jgi:hypothetical protein
LADFFLTVFMAVLLAQLVSGIFRSGLSSEDLDEKLEVLKVEIVSEIVDELRPDTDDPEE